MEEQDLLEHISNLVEEEKRLRDPDGSEGAATVPEDDHRAERLRRVEEQLDQCWDLLRQRRAKKHAGSDPDEASARPVNEVEGYRQ